MNITKSIILKALDDAIIKCRPTIAEMHKLLDGWSQKEKNALIRWGMPHGYEGFDVMNPHERKMEFYESLLEEGDEEEIFQYEKQIFKVLSKTRIRNIVENLADFDENNYHRDEETGYPNPQRGVSEKRQEELQEAEGYEDKVIRAFGRWTDGSYEEIQHYVMTGEYRDSVFYDGYLFKEAGDSIMEYISNSIGLNENTLMFRGGHWDVGMKVGDVGTIPCLNSLSYSKDTAYDLGIGGEMDDEGNLPPNRYLIDVYVDEGYKGAMVNAPSLAKNFPEHEYLINKGSRYIVLEVDDENQTAKIKLLPPED